MNPLFTALVDDAGLFPPTSLGMSAALARHQAARAAAHPVLTHRFLCPASRLPELQAALPATTVLPKPTGPTSPSPQADPGDRTGSRGRTELADTTKSIDVSPHYTDATESRDDGAARPGPLMLGVIVDVDDPALAEVSADPRLAVALLEVPLAGKKVEAVAGWFPRGLPVYLEPPRGDFKAVDRIAAFPGLGAKVRCGGVRPELFPSIEELRDFIVTCVAARVPFKATAGLHHAVRYTDQTTGFTHHGFLNLLLAVCAAVSGRTADMDDLLSSNDAEGLAAEARRIDPETAALARTSLVAYGSCSISAPLDDLSALGLLPALGLPSASDSFPPSDSHRPSDSFPPSDSWRTRA